MAKEKTPNFRSLEEERTFWETHDAFEVLGEEGWEVVKENTTGEISLFGSCKQAWRMGESAENLA